MHPAATVTVTQIAPGSLLLDVREDDEWAAGHIAGAIHLPMGDVPGAVQAGDQRIVGLDPATPVVVVCAVGGRSGRVAAWLNSQGLPALNLIGGMHAWADAGLPMESDTGTTPVVL